MKKVDHDYEGKDRRQHQMSIHAEFDGNVIWLWMEGVHSWEDGCYTHRWTHALLPETLVDIVRCSENAMYVYMYKTEVLPQTVKEIGCLDYIDDIYGVTLSSEVEQCSH